MAEADQRRLFFALWPDEAVRQEIIQRRECLGALGGRRVPDHNLHLTLLFLGDQPAERLGEIEAAAHAVNGAGCKLVLDRFGWFPGARVAWLGGEPSGPLQAVHSDLAQRMEALNLSVDARPFRAHVTLFRQIPPRPVMPDVEPLHWPVKDFALIESRRGKPYRMLSRWPLNGSAAD